MQIVLGPKETLQDIPYNDASKTPTFFTAPGSTIYHAFNAMFEANDASVPYQHVLQLDKSYLPQDQATFNPTECMADENLNLRKKDQNLGNEKVILNKKELTNHD